MTLMKETRKENCERKEIRKRLEVVSVDVMMMTMMKREKKNTVCQRVNYIAKDV